MVIHSYCASRRCRRKPITIVNRATKPSIVNNSSSFYPPFQSTPVKQQRKSTTIPIEDIKTELLLKNTQSNTTVNEVLENTAIGKIRYIEEVPVEDYRFVDISDQSLGSVKNI